MKKGRKGKDFVGRKGGGSYLECEEGEVGSGMGERVKISRRV